MFNALSAKIRRRTALLFGSSLLISAGCGNACAAPAPKQTESRQAPRTLILYFSMPEATGRVRELTEDEENSTVTAENRLWGNNEWLAELIRRETGADVIRITPEVPYPTDHKTLVALARKEQKEKVLPKLSEETRKALTKLPEYDLIYLGYPIWWYTFPRILITTLSSISLAGKTVAPFSAHGGSALADTEEVLRAMHPGVRLAEGFEIYRDDMEKAEKRIPLWVKKVLGDYRHGA